MNFSNVCVALVKRFEGLRLKSYPDPATGGEPWTIGWGHTKAVRPGQTITPDEAEDLLNQDLGYAATRVAFTFADVPLSQSQFDALTSLAFNVGSLAMVAPRLCMAVKNRQWNVAATEFLNIDKAANGVVMPGLQARRLAESQLFLSV